MGYRYNIPVDANGEPPKPEDQLMRFDVRNGAVMRLAFDCRYCIKDANHPMWTFPRYPGDVAIARRPDGTPYYHLNDVAWPYETEKINFLDEDYRYVDIAFEDDAMASNIEARGWIDTSDPNIIRVEMKTNFDTFHDKPKEARFTVFVATPIVGESQRIDAVCHGIVVILPGKKYTPPAEEEVPSGEDEEQGE